MGINQLIAVGLFIPGGYGSCVAVYCCHRLNHALTKKCFRYVSMNRAEPDIRYDT